jgi:hypothetical protein
MEAIFTRLGVQVASHTTASQPKAVAHLQAALEAGQPAIVWADMTRLAYNAAEPAPFPVTLPLVVYGYDEAAGVVSIADRARVPLTAALDELAAARARQGNLKNRLLTLALPALPADFSAVLRDSIRRTAHVFLNGPEKGPKVNFGLAGLLKWADMVVEKKDKKGWPRLFPPGGALYGNLIALYEAIELQGTGGGASRGLYADFLVEAAQVVGQTDLKRAADLFRQSAARWTELADTLLPDSVPLLKETRELLCRRDHLFRESGMASLEERRQIGERLRTIKGEAATRFPLSGAETAAMRGGLRERILTLHEAEKPAALALQGAVG